ncbi:MAG: SEL1-like repeat protein [Limisphaerales bacterium]
MTRILLLIGCLSLLSAAAAEPTAVAPVPEKRSERLILEEKHFVECLAYVYSPSLWIGHNGSLYFAPKDETQVRQIEALKAARSRYVALTNAEERYELAAQVIADSGLDDAWSKKLLLPYSETKPNLTPTLSRPFHVVSGYKVVQPLESGDAVIESQQGNFLVLNFARPGSAPNGTNLFLVNIGEKAFATAPGQYQHIEACSIAVLTKEQEAVLLRVVAAFEKRAASLAQELAGFKAKQDFENSKARATDNNPFLQYQLARCYLEGKGAPKDEKLGLEWMRRAAVNGSGDAKSYLRNLGQNAR